MESAAPFFNASASHIAMMQRPYGPRIHMDENAAGGAPAGGGEAAGAIPESFASADAAARFLISRRQRDEQPGADADAGDNDFTSDDGADHGAPDHELSDEGNAAPDHDQAPGESEGDDAEAEKLPPVERPRSWAKEEQAEWDDLPRSLQEKIAAREDAREKALRKGQNDAAEKLKGLTAREQAAEQARQAYEGQARQALNVLMREQLARFPDIKTMADVVKLSETDPLRFIQWQAHQQDLQVQAAAVKEADDRGEKQKAEAWNSFRAKENATVLEHIPELGDAEKAPKIMQRAVAHLQSLGFTAEELGAFDKGEKLSLFDHRLQRLIFDGMRYQDVQKAAKSAAKKPVPPVQRPGVKAAGNGASERVQSLNSKLNSSGSLKDAAALLVARRNARR